MHAHRVGVALAIVLFSAAAHADEPAFVPAAPAPAPAVAPTIPDAPSPTRLEELTGVELTVDSTVPDVSLYRADDTRMMVQRGYPLHTWQLVCRAPCDKKVPTDGRFRVMGGTIIASDDFALDTGTSKVTIKVDAGSVAMRRAADIVFGFGLGALGAGATTVLVSAATDDHATKVAYQRVGLVALGAALVLDIAAVVLYARSSTSVRLVTPAQGR